MGKPSGHNIASEGEFFKLGEVLTKSGNDLSTCLVMLEKNLVEYDRRNGNHFTNTASSYIRSDMRTAKDTAMELKHVGRSISTSHTPSKTEIVPARNMLEATTKAIDSLKISARNYDRENGQRMGVKGTIDSVVGGNNDNNQHDEVGGSFHDNNNAKEHHNGLFQTKDDNGGGIMGSSETVETVVAKILRNHFNLGLLEHQIAACEKSLSPSIMERAKEKIHDAKQKITGEKYEDRIYQNEGVLRE